VSEPDPSPNALALLAVLDEAEASRQKADKAVQALAQESARGRTLFDAVHDAARAHSLRSRELKESARQLRDPLERARLTALNAGLEGARKGDPVGKALVVMAEELRVLLARALDALAEHSAALTDVDREREQWVEQLGAARELSGTLFEKSRELQVIDAGSARALERLGESLRSVVGVDPERARLLLRAAEQARALDDSLSRLQAGSHEPELAAVLEPLAKKLGREGDG
jgi:hypothetical protein